jgi:hypothetical protein
MSNLTTVYQSEMYDVSNDAMKKSRRWATREAINWVGGVVLENTATEVDASFVGGEIRGMTARDFDPHRRSGDLQRQVNA